MLRVLLHSPGRTAGRIDQLAEAAGLDMAKYHKDLVDPALAAQIDRDIREGEAAGVSGTPTFFLDGKRVDSLDELEQRLTATSEPQTAQGDVRVMRRQ